MHGARKPRSLSDWLSLTRAERREAVERWRFATAVVVRRGGPGPCGRCGEATCEVVFGRLTLAQARVWLFVSPRPASEILGEPCPDCADLVARGRAVYEAEDGPSGPVPTGRWLVLRDEAAERLLRLPLGPEAWLDPKGFAALGVEGKK